MLSTKKVIAMAKELGFTNSDLAEKLNLAVSTVDAWAKGEKEVYPSLTRQLCDIFGCESSEISTDVDKVTGDVMPEPISDHTVKTSEEPDEDESETPAEQETSDASAESSETTPEKVVDNLTKEVKTEVKHRRKRTVRKKESDDVMLSDMLINKMKETNYKSRDINQSDVNASIQWFGDYAKNLENELKTGINLLSGAVREFNRMRVIKPKTDDSKFSKQALEVATKFDKLSDTNKTALLTILASLK